MWGGQQLAAGPVEVAGDGQQGGDRPVVLQAVAVVAQGRGGLVEAHPGILMDQRRSRLHLRKGHAGEGLDVVPVELPDVFGVFLKAVDVLPDIGHVNPAVSNEHIGDGVGQRTVGARAGLEEQVRQLFAGRSTPGVHNQELQPLLFQLHGLFGLHIGRVEGVEGPAQKQVAVVYIRVGLISRRQLPGHKGRRIAGAGLTAVVGTAEGVGEPPEHLPVPLGVARVEGHALRAILLLGPVQPIANLLVGLLPADGLKFSRAPGTHPAERRHDPVFPVDVLPVGQPLGAQPPVIHRMAVHALDLNHSSILHICVDAAVHPGGTDVAHGGPDGNARVLPRNLAADFPLQLRHIPASKVSIMRSGTPYRTSCPRCSGEKRQGWPRSTLMSWALMMPDTP